MSLPPPLPKEEQDALFRAMRKARRGTPAYRQARDTLIDRNRRFASWVPRKTVPLTLADSEDLEQAALVGLIKAVDTFDPDGGYSWPQHARLHITHEVSAALRGAARVAYIPRDRQQEMFRAANSPDATAEDRAAVSRATKAAPIEDAETVADTAPAPEDCAEEADAHARLWQAVQSLPGLEAAVIASRIGLDTPDGDPQTLREIAARLGIPESKASKLEARGFARLRHPSRAARLEAYS